MRKLISIFLLLFAVNAHAAQWFYSNGTSLSGTDYWGHNSSCGASAGTVSVDTSVNGPDGSPGVWKFTYPAGWCGGDGVADVAFWSITSFPVNEYWVQFKIKYIRADGGAFQHHEVEDKVWLFYPYNTITGVKPAGWTWAPQGGNDAYNHLPNVNTEHSYSTDTAWHTVKMHFVGSTGTYELWIDSIKRSNYTGMDMGGSTAFYDLRFVVIWGGMGGTVSSTQYMYLDDIYVGSTDPGGSTVVDQSPPYTEQLSPADGSTGNLTTNRVISLHVKDAGAVVSNVLRSSVVMQVSVNGGASSSYSYALGGLTFSPSSANSADFTVTRTQGSDWSKSDVVSVKVDATDVAGNVMPQKAYSFSIEHDTVPTPSGGKAQVLAYLTNLPNQSTKKILSGQRIGFVDGGGDDDGIVDFTAVAAKSGGVYPAIMAFDFGDYDARTYDLTRIINHWNAGGLVHAVAHWSNPAAANVWAWPLSYPMFTLSQAYTPGNSTYNNFRANLVALGDGIQTLATDNVVLMFAPFHEPNDDNDPPTFWWAGGGAGNSTAQYIALWRYVHDYITVTRGLTNVIWVFATTRYPDPEPYYPGDAYVDVVGIDYYSETDRFNDSTARNYYTTLLTHGKPFAITELGQCSGGEFDGAACEGRDARVIINDLSTYFPKAAWWYNWDDEWALGNQNFVTNLFADPRVINRSDNPAGVAVGVPLSVYTTGLPNGKVTVAYTATLLANGGRSPYTWSIVSGTPPAGLTLSGSTITGIPTGAGDITTSITVRCTDAASTTADKSLTIYIAPATPTATYTTTTASIAATFINSVSPTTNNSGDNVVYVYQLPAGTVVTRAFDNVGFSLPSNAVVQSATWEGTLSQVSGGGGTNPMRIHIYPVSGSVPIGTVTWANFAGTIGAEVGVISVGTIVGTKYTADVTGIVRAAHLAGKSSFLLAFDGGGDGVSDTNRKFNAQSVTIKYTVTDDILPSPAAPGHMSISGTMNFR